MTAIDDGVLDHLRAVAELPDLSETKYQMIRRLDRGGMGTVYVVKDTELAREVALKVLSAPDASGELSSRLVAEARHLARLEHPNIVPVHDIGRLPDGRVFYAMKLVRGKRLDVWAREGPSRPAMLRLFQKVCGAVAFAHARGVIHRDLKPENIMVGAFGEALVLDWGVAKLMEAEPARGAGAPRGEPPGPDTLGRGATAEGAVIGTPAYMAPEQARGEIDRLGPGADVYALGAILYFLLTRRPPFDGPTPREVLDKVIAERPAPPRQIDRSIPKALESICARAMEPDPARRYRTAQELADDVERHLDGLPPLAHREGLLEKAGRFLARNKALVWLLIAYLVMRIILLAAAGR